MLCHVGRAPQPHRDPVSRLFPRELPGYRSSQKSVSSRWWLRAQCPPPPDFDSDHPPPTTRPPLHPPLFQFFTPSSSIMSKAVEKAISTSDAVRPHFLAALRSTRPPALNERCRPRSALSVAVARCQPRGHQEPPEEAPSGSGCHHEACTCLDKLRQPNSAPRPPTRSHTLSP